MAARVLGEKGALFSAGSSYAKFRPTYPQELYNRIFEFTDKSSRDVALDIGCGTGQVTNVLGSHFASVIGIDPSASQIEAAKVSSSMSNVKYIQGNGEELSLITDNSIDLITIAQAMHWLDQSLIWKECDRVLKPGGTIAIWGYALPYIEHNKVTTSIIQEHHNNLWAGGFWDEARKLVDNHYNHLCVPYNEKARIDLVMTKETNIDGLMGYLGTFSALKTLLSKLPEGGVSPLVDIRKRIAENTKDHSAVPVAWPVFLALCKKPK